MEKKHDDEGEKKKCHGKVISSNVLGTQERRGGGGGGGG